MFRGFVLAAECALSAPQVEVAQHEVLALEIGHLAKGPAPSAGKAVAMGTASFRTAQEFLSVHGAQE